MSVRVTQSALQLVTEGEAVRVTQAALQLVTVPSAVRVTQAALQLVTVPSAVRVTQAALQLVIPGGIGALVLIASVTDTTVNFTVAVDPSYLEIRYQVALASDPTFASPISDLSYSGFDRFAPTAVTGLTALTDYLVQIAVRDATGWYPFEVPAVAFTTLAPGSGGPGGGGGANGAFLFVAPDYGEPAAGAYTVKWNMPTGAGTTDLWISEDLGASWVQLGAALTLPRFVLDTTAYPDGNDYLLRIDFDDPAASTETHFGFKIENAPTFPTSYAQYTGAIGTGTAAHRLLWDLAHSWYPLPYDGTCATVGLDALFPAAVAIPPGAAYADEVDVTSWVSAGSLTVWRPVSLSWANRYLALEGRFCGVGVGMTGSIAGGDCRGIVAGFRFGMVLPGTQDETDGRCGPGSRFQVGIMDTPTANPTTGLYDGGYPGNVFAWADGSGAASLGFIPIRLRVTRVSPTHVNIKAGMCGWNGSDYWLVEEDNVAFAIPVIDGNCVGNCGWVQDKGNSAVWSEAYSDARTLGVTRLSTTPCDGGDAADLLEPSKPCVVQLDVYEADRTTVAWTVTDDPADPASVQLLKEPSSYGAQIVDFLQGSASIATVTVTIIDPPTIAGDQDSGIITGRLADAITKVGAVKGRRGRLRRFISPAEGWVTIVDGDCMEPFLAESFSAISFAIRDTRERERKTKAFQRGETTSLLPMGRFHPDTVGVSQPAFGSYINNVIALSGFVSYGTGSGFVFPGGYYQPGTPGHVTVTLSGWSSPPPSGFVLGSEQLVVFPEAEEQFAGQIDYASPAGANLSYPVIYPKVVIWWRERFTSDPWTKLKPRFEAVGNYAHPVGTTAQPIPPCVTVFDATFLGEDVRGAYEVLLAPIGSTSLLPADGLEINLLIQYIGPPTDSMPFHWSGTLGELLQAAYDGEVSPKAPTIPADPYTYDPGTAISTGIRYDAAVLATMTETVLLRVTEPVDDLRDWLEKYAYAPSGWAPALDRDGQVSPVHRRFPTSTAGLLTVDNSIATAEAGFRHGDTVINLLRFDYNRVFLKPIDEDGIPIGYVDGLQLQEVQRWYAAAGGNLPIAVTGPEFLPSVSDSIALFGERLHTIEARAFHVDQAIGLAFDPNMEQPAVLAALSAVTLLPRYAFGTPVVDVPVRRDATATLRAGDWVGLDLSWMPDYRTGRRGLQRFAQIFELPDLNCAGRRLRMELGEALNLRTYSGHSGGGSGGSAPYSSVPYTPA
jgi:hypothetical protein